MEVFFLENASFNYYNCKLPLKIFPETDKDLQIIELIPFPLLISNMTHDR